MNQSNKFPDLTTALSGALEDQPVLLDGQTVVFDRKVTLMPVMLEKKADTEKTPPTAMRDRLVRFSGDSWAMLRPVWWWGRRKIWKAL